MYSDAYFGVAGSSVAAARAFRTLKLLFVLGSKLVQHLVQHYVKLLVRKAQTCKKEASAVDNLNTCW